MEIPLKGMLGVPRRQPDDEEVKIEDQSNAFMIVKKLMDDEQLESLALIKPPKSSNLVKKNKGGLKAIYDLHYATMEVLYPKWFNECLQDSPLAK